MILLVNTEKGLKVQSCLCLFIQLTCDRKTVIASYNHSQVVKFLLSVLDLRENLVLLSKAKGMQLGCLVALIYV